VSERVFGGDGEDDVIWMMQKCQGLFFSQLTMEIAEVDA